MVETAEMMTDWATEPELGPSDTPLMKLAHEVVGMYKDVYYAHRRAEADRAADSIAAQKSLAEEQAAREKIASDLADQQAACAAERATLLRDMAAALRDKDAAEHELASARRQAMDAALLLKEAVEVNSQVQTDLRIRTEQVYELRRQLHSSGTPPPL